MCGSGSSDRSGDSERSGEWNCESVSDMDESDLLVLWLLPRVSIRFSLWFVFVGTEWKRKERKRKWSETFTFDLGYVRVVYMDHSNTLGTQRMSHDLVERNNLM